MTNSRLFGRTSQRSVTARNMEKSRQAASALQTTHLNVLSDAPARDSDEFRTHTNCAKALLDILTSCPDRTVVGLFGRWGAGKSTVVELIKKQLESDSCEDNSGKPHLQILHFDMWRYSGDSLRRWLLLELHDQLKLVSFEFQGRKFPEALYSTAESKLMLPSINESFVKTVGTRGFVLAYASLIAFWLFSLLAGLRQFVFAAAAAVGSLVAFYFAALGLADYVGNAIKETISCASKVTASLMVKQETTGTTVKPFEFQEQFEQIFRSMVRTATSSSAKRLVLCFDNVDRVDESIAVELLSTIKTYLEIESCVYLVPCDDEALIRHLTSESKDEVSAREFLDKCYQVIFRIPPLLTFDLDDYLAKLSTQSGLNLPPEAQEVVLLAYRESTPRQLKRFINDLVAFLTTAKIAERELLHNYQLTDDMRMFVMWAILHCRWPQFVHRLKSDPDLWFEIREELTASRKSKLLADAHGADELHQFLNSTLSVPSPADVLPFITLKVAAFEEESLYAKTLRYQLREGQYEKIQNALKVRDAHAVARIILEAAQGFVSGQRKLFARNALTTLLQLRSEIPTNLRPKTTQVISALIDYLLLRTDDSPDTTLSDNASYFSSLIDYYPHMPEDDQSRFGKWFVQLFSDCATLSRHCQSIQLLFPLIDSLSATQRISIGESLAKQLANESNAINADTLRLLMSIHESGSLTKLSSLVLARRLTNLLSNELKPIGNPQSYTNINPSLLSAWLAVRRDLDDECKTIMENALWTILNTNPPDARTSEGYQILSHLVPEDFTESGRNRLVGWLISKVPGQQLDAWRTFLPVIKNLWPAMSPQQQDNFDNALPERLKTAAPDMVINLFSNQSSDTVAFVLSLKGIQTLPGVLQMWTQQHAQQAQGHFRNLFNRLSGDSLARLMQICLDVRNESALRVQWDRFKADMNNMSAEPKLSVLERLLDAAASQPSMSDLVVDMSSLVKSRSDVQSQPLLERLLTVGTALISKDAPKGIVIVTTIGAMVAPDRRSELCKQLLREHVQPNVSSSGEVLKQIIDLSKEIPLGNERGEVAATESKYAFELSKTSIDQGSALLMELIGLLLADDIQERVDDIIRVWTVQETSGKPIGKASRYLDFIEGVKDRLTPKQLPELRKVASDLLAPPKTEPDKDFALKLLKAVPRLYDKSPALESSLNELAQNERFKGIVIDIMGTQPS